jgi:tyrosine-protein phosphatase SIW14
LNIYKVDEGIFRGPAPQNDDDWKTLAQAKIKYVLDLESGAAWFNDGSPLQEAWKGDWFGLRVYAHPLGGIWPPTKLELEDAVKFLRHYQPVYVHCKQGVDRTGMVVAYYRIENKDWEKSKAVEEMNLMGFHKRYFWWKWFL